MTFRASEPAEGQATAAGAPRPPQTLVSRERLRAALDRGSQLPLTMLIAPAGTGKTVLISDWVMHREAAGRSVLWVTATVAASALEAALLQGARAARRSEFEDPARTLPTRLRGAWDAASPPDVVVIDDAHQLSVSSVAVLAAVLTEAPHTVRLVLATRRDLALPVAELELRGLASTLRAADLRFTDTEAAALVHAHAETATDEHVVALQRRTAGWAAALVLAARTIVGPADRQDGAAPNLFTEQPVLDLLLGETFALLGGRVQTVLLSTFGTRTLTGPLAAVLSGDTDSGAILADLADKGLLITAFTDGPGTETVYEYHPLLVELLRRRVVSGREEARVVVAARRRAAVHYANRGQNHLALDSALGAEDPDLVARVLVGSGPALLCSGECRLVGAGFEALPDGFVDAHPQLLGVRGLMRRLIGDITGAALDAAAADAASSGTAATVADDALEADALVLRLWQCRYGWYDAQHAIDRAKRFILVDRPVDSGQRRAVLGPDRLALLLIELAAAETWTGNLDEALTHLDQALIDARMAGHPQLTAAGLAHRAVLQYVRGQIQSAERSALAALANLEAGELADEYGTYIVRAHVVLGLTALHQLDFSAARHWHQLSTRADVAYSDTVVAVLRVVLGAGLLIEDGRIDDALTELTTDPAAAGPLPSFLARDLALQRLYIAVLVDARGAISDQLDVLDRIGHGLEADLARAVYTVVEGDTRATVEAIDAALARPGAHPVVAAAAAGVRTALLVRLGDEQAAAAALTDLLNRIVPQRLLLALTTASCEPAFLSLLDDQARAGNAHTYTVVAAKKLTAYRAGWLRLGGRNLLDPAPRQVVAAVVHRRLDAVINGARIRLTTREADVLDQLTLGSSYAEIADALYITQNTVKTHVVSLYRKLGVEKRSAALRVARSLDLVQR